MPCNSDYLEPNGREIELQRAARLLLFCYQTMGAKGITSQLKKAAQNHYCDSDYVSDLCKFLTDLKKISYVNFERFIYNGKDKNCRDLADWWDEHQKADRERELQEHRNIKENKLKKSALSKLSNEEKRVLGLE